MTVKELKEGLSAYPDDMLIGYLAEDHSSDSEGGSFVDTKHPIEIMGEYDVVPGSLVGDQMFYRYSSRTPVPENSKRVLILRTESYW